MNTDEMKIPAPKGFRAIEPEQLADNVFKAIGEDWMLIAARKKDGSFNMMTASWGGLGVLWGQPVFTCFIRPQRYTLEFAEEADLLSLSFFGGKQREALTFCGSKSGRDFDKAKETGLIPRLDADGLVFFDQATLVIAGRKLYVSDFKKENFTDPSIPAECYPTEDYHRVFICRADGIFVKA